MREGKKDARSDDSSGSRHVRVNAGEEVHNRTGKTVNTKVKRKENSGKIQYDTYTFSRRELMKYSATGLAIGLFAVWVCYRSFWALPLSVVIAVIYVRSKRKQLAEDRKNLLNYHFRDFLSSLHTAMLAGYSLENAVTIAAGDVARLYGRDDICSIEMKAITRQMGYQKPVEQLFLELGKRSGVEDIQTFGEVISVAKRTGGDMNGVLQNAWQTLGEKIDTQREIDTMMASRKYEMKIMNLMPAGIILYLSVSFDGFMDAMYGNAFGVCVMTVCLGIYGFAVWLGDRLMAVKV